MLRRLFLLSFSLWCWVSCHTAQRQFQPNPAAPGFNQKDSDPKAIQIADAVMAAQGGRGAWDALRYLSWSFMGRRTLLWDKFTGNVRIDWVQKKQTIVVNILNGGGKVWLDGVAVSQPDTLAKYLDMGKQAWINDSYWLVMPFKLKDTGVTLRYLGEGKTDSGIPSDILQLTFAGVGVTPDNKYHIWVDQSDHLVKQWAYFAKYSDEQPKLTTPWADYRTMSPAPVKLSANRGNRSLAPVETPTQVPPGIFENL